MPEDLGRHRRGIWRGQQCTGGQRNNPFQVQASLLLSLASPRLWTRGGTTVNLNRDSSCRFSELSKSAAVLPKTAWPALIRLLLLEILQEGGEAATSKRDFVCIQDCSKSALFASLSRPWDWLPRQPTDGYPPGVKPLVPDRFSRTSMLSEGQPIERRPLEKANDVPAFPGQTRALFIAPRCSMSRL